MVFGFMRKSTHEAVVAALEERICYLELKTQLLQDRVISAKNQAQTSEKVTIEKQTVVAKPSKPVSNTKKPLVSTPNKILSQQDKLDILGSVLPNVDFEAQHRSIIVKLHGIPTQVRLAIMNVQGGRKRWAFNGVKPGQVCVALNEDKSLRSVFVLTANDIADKGSFSLFQGTQRDIKLIQNTGLVIRNLK